MSIYEANAKINLFLEMIEKRNDGYHSLSSIMQSVSLCDIVDVGLVGSREGISVSCDSDLIPTDQRNIVYKAARAFFDYSGISAGVKIHIKKRIPSQAGMGGGSADGAAVIRALDELTGTIYPEDLLRNIAARVGADLPFCLYGGCREVAGIGEKNIEVLPSPDCSLLIVKTGECISTPAAYKALDAGHADFESYKARDCFELRESLKSGNHNFEKSLYNIFETVLPELAPKTLSVIEFLRERSRAALLCGSGSAVFAVTENEKESRSLRESVISAYGDVYTTICRPVDTGIKMIREEI